MSTRLIVQSTGSDDPKVDNFARYMQLEQPIHEDYAKRCDADYLYFVGYKGENHLNPTWNRLPMILEAFDDGYAQVAWLDADMLVVQPDRNIFEEVRGAPMHMTRTQGFPWWTPNGEVEAWNDGILVVENCRASRDALEWTWAQRHAPFLPHQVPGMPELSWLLDYVFANDQRVAGLVRELEDIWNFMPYLHMKHREHEAVIKAWHGIPHQERWQQFQACYEEHYG